MLAKFPSPSRGSYISTKSEIVTTNSRCFVLVPFSGFLYLYSTPSYLQEYLEEKFSSPSRGSYILYETKVNYDGLAVFSSPSRGSYISTSVKSFVNEQDSSSRPLPGVLISLQCEAEGYPSYGNNVLVPFPGFLYLYARSSI